MLLVGQRLAGMNRYWQHRRRAVGDSNASARERDLNELLREVARRMSKTLMRGSDVRSRRIVVCAEVDRRETAIARVEESRKQRASRAIDDRLRTSTMISNCSVRSLNPRDRSRLRSTATTYVTCSTTVIFGTVMTHLGGKRRRR
jgi:hypothetical protein